MKGTLLSIAAIVGSSTGEGTACGANCPNAINNNMTGSANGLKYYVYSKVPFGQSTISGNTDPNALLPNFA